jgi:hypothetical protein
MSRIEFTAELKENTIEIPEEYRGHIRGIVRVIILSQEHADQPDLIAQLLTNPIEIANFTPLTRDDVNERSS